MSELSDEEKKKYRPFRAGSWAMYLIVACTFSSLIIFSVFKSVLEMTPGTPAIAGSALGEEDCMQRARQLFVELEARRKSLGEAKVIAHADQDFLTFRVEWLTRKRAVEARCGLDSRPNVREAMASLDRVLDLYTTASVQFSGGVGPSVDELKKQLGGQ